VQHASLQCYLIYRHTRCRQLAKYRYCRYSTLYGNVSQSASSSTQFYSADQSTLFASSSEFINKTSHIGWRLRHLVSSSASIVASSTSTCLFLLPANFTDSATAATIIQRPTHGLYRTVYDMFIIF